MPKSHFRYKHMDRGGGNGSGVVDFQSNVNRSDFLVSTPPRKVSFEDSRHDSELSICSDDTVPTKNNNTMKAGETTDSEQERRRPIRKKRSLLVRPVTSLSLVDLAKSVAQEGASPAASERNNGDMIEERNSKRVRPFNVSPRSVVHASDLSGVDREIFSSLHQSSSEGESKSIRASPWGHFIDMAPDDDEYFDLPRSSYSNYYNCMVKKGRRGVAVKSCKDSLCRLRRRPTPYGEYKKSYAIRVERPTLSFIGLRTDTSTTTSTTKSKRKFRLSPRRSERTHRSADELIGVFSELQVRHAEQN